MTVADNVRKLCAEAERYIELQLDIAESLADFRERATEQGIDWSQAKALLVARARDARDGGRRLEKLASKAENVAVYLSMISTSNMADKRKNPPQSSQLAAGPIGEEPAADKPPSDEAAGSPIPIGAAKSHLVGVVEPALTGSPAAALPGSGREAASASQSGAASPPSDYGAGKDWPADRHLDLRNQPFVKAFAKLRS